SMSMFGVLVCGARAAGTTTPTGACAGGIEKNHVASTPAPEMTAVDFQSIVKVTPILTFRSRQPLAIPWAGIHASRFSFLRSCSRFVQIPARTTKLNTNREPRTQNGERQVHACYASP